ncbi:hypothetical protein [Haloarchaeobius sp. DFWS5]|uniref:hypothetical protein n=1 Tax=Haloarchaeobius sp. DFWS5 TaxID=3446114 RepID=UPI003EBBEFF9
MSDSTEFRGIDEDSPCYDRRTILRVGSAGLAATLAVPTLSGVTAAHYPEKLTIDVRPWTEENTIDPHGRGVVPVAVYYTEFQTEAGETVVFDPVKRPKRYRFGSPAAVDDGGGARPVWPEVEHDASGDGSPDLVLLFPVEDTGFTGDETVAKLVWEGDESGKHGFAGTDSVSIVGGPPDREKPIPPGEATPDSPASAG